MTFLTSRSKGNILDAFGCLRRYLILLIISGLHGHHTCQQFVTYTRMHFLSNIHWGSERFCATTNFYQLLIHGGRFYFRRNLHRSDLTRYTDDIQNSPHLLFLIDLIAFNRKHKSIVPIKRAFCKCSHKKWPIQRRKPTHLKKSTCKLFTFKNSVTKYSFKNQHMH